MLTLFKIAEFVVVFFVIRSLLRIFKPAEKQKTPKRDTKRQRTERFESDSKDISDADYEEL